MRFTPCPLDKKIQVNCALQLWIPTVLRDMLNKVVLKTWLDHLGWVFLHSVIVIDISSDLGANARAAV